MEESKGDVMTVEIGFDAAQTGLLFCIFWRMGFFTAAISSIKENVIKLTERVDQIEEDIRA